MTGIDEARAAARARFAHLADGDMTEVSGPIDPDNPPMTDIQLARLRPATEVIPGLVVARLRRTGDRPSAPSPKIAISIHLDSDVVEALRSAGEGWQARVNDLLRSALAIGPGAVTRSEVDDVAWLENIGDVVRRAFAGEPVAPDEIKQMAEAVQRRPAPPTPR